MKTLKKYLVTMVAIVMVVGCVIGFTACANNEQSDAEYIEGKGTLICGITLYEPMNYADDEGEMTGFETEFAEAVCEKLGLKAKFQVIKWNSKEAELNSKSIDCIWNGFTVTEDRKENVDFSQSYINNTQCLVCKKSDLSEYTSKDAIAGKKGAAESGSAGETAAKEIVSESNYTAVNAQVTALTEVLGGTVDFAIVDVVLANSMVGKGSYTDLAIANGIEFEAEEYAIGFRKGSDMVAKVNAAINELRAEGKLAALAEKYGLSGQLIK